MKKIDSLSELRRRQLSLVRRRYELEHDIRNDWDRLRHHFEAASFARETLWSGIGWLGRRLFRKEGRHGAEKHSHLL